ncbi:MAG: methylated-DNA--[protein]-cysteine S-methyltransferase [Candidatus Rokubacteria bacterium]|nr:methylated-DNA--[protein]-cysteine S-methyltransferase [Candidatus Rokubacteria bacterium]
MTTKPQVCRAIEPDLVASAMGEAGAAATERVEGHVARCAPCRGDWVRYRAIDSVARALPRAEPPSETARAALGSRLADLRRRLVTYAIVASPLGQILIARSEEGVAAIEYLGDATTARASRLARTPGVELEEDGAEIERLQRELLDYLGGRRTRLDWRLDLRLASSDFHRAVLQATASVPYGAVTSYARIATGIGRPAAVRAVAQALRWNPVPIVVPCHRIVGASGSLTGYAGSKLTLKQRLLSVEGVSTQRAAHDFRVARDRMYARDLDDTEYCVPTCGSLARKTLARLTLFSSREGAESAGLAPCTSCRPDLHPLPR